MKLYEIADNVPLTFILMKQLLDKGEFIYMQRQRTINRQDAESAKRDLGPALFKIQKLEQDNDSIHITVTVTYNNDNTRGWRPPHRMSFYGINLDDLFILDRSPKGKWVLHRKNVDVTDRLDSDDTE